MMNGLYFRNYGLCLMCNNLFDVDEATDIVWQIFLFITKEVSKNAIPCIHQVIPFMDGLFNTLDDHASDKKKHSAIRMAVTFQQPLDGFMVDRWGKNEHILR